MEFNVDWTDLIWKAAVFIATFVVFPLAKAAWDWFKTQKLFKYIEKYIAFAEGYFGAESGAEKKAYVMDMLRKMKLVNAKNEQYISALIDGFCETMTTDGYINKVDKQP